jgi:hypothetical protein
VVDLPFFQITDLGIGNFILIGKKEQFEKSFDWELGLYNNNYVCLFGFNVTPTRYRSFGDVPALLVEEDLRCPSVHYFRHERAPE